MKIAVLISSFDGFSDCWRPLDLSIQKYWKNCKWPIYLITNECDFDSVIIKTIKIGADCGWASNLKKALHEVDADYVLYLQDDYWLNDFVDDDKIQLLVSSMKSNSWLYYRLMPWPKPEKKDTNYQNHGVCTINSKYRICLQASIWQKDFLENMLVEGESGWDFEINSKDRAKAYLEGCYSVWDTPLISYVDGTAVRKNKWTRQAIDYIENENVVVEISKREVEGKLISHLASYTNLLRYPSRYIIRCLNNWRINI